MINEHLTNLETPEEALHQLLICQQTADESGTFMVDDVTFKIVASVLSIYSECEAHTEAERQHADALAEALRLVANSDMAQREEDEGNVSDTLRIARQALAAHDKRRAG